MPRLLAASCLVVLVLVAVPMASGELVQGGNVRLAFDAQLTPKELPRDRAAPIRVRIDGAIRTTDGSPPPRLERIDVELNRRGRLSFRGLPSCPASALQQTTTEAALEECRPALVGRGRFAANVDFPERPTIPLAGETLFFNGGSPRRPRLFLHFYGSSPVRATFVLPFTIARRARGDFGTVLSTRIPRIASDVGYVTDLELAVHRVFRHAGRKRSFLSASCAAPAGFRIAIFPFARTTFHFANGQKLRATLTRDCRVRG